MPENTRHETGYVLSMTSETTLGTGLNMGGGGHRYEDNTVEIWGSITKPGVNERRRTREPKSEYDTKAARWISCSREQQSLLRPKCKLDTCRLE